MSIYSFPWWLSGEESACIAGDADLIPGKMWEDPLEEGMATHSSILAWKIPWTEEPGRLRSMGSQRVGHNWSDRAQTYPSIYLYTYIYVCNCIYVHRHIHTHTQSFSSRLIYTSVLIVIFISCFLVKLYYTLLKTSLLMFSSKQPRPT